MKISDMYVNHIKNPIGYEMREQTFSWKYQGDVLENEGILESRIEISTDDKFETELYDSGFKNDISAISHELQLGLLPCTRYYWRVQAVTNRRETIVSETAFFETGKMEQPWEGKWISIKDNNKASPIVRGVYTVSKPIKKARGYMTGLGLYECYLNGKLVNDGYLQPGFHNYNYWLQYQTFDLTKAMIQGKNIISFLLGAGWYKGRFGVNGGYENNFGENYHILCEIHLEYEDGSSEIFGSDDTFRYKDGPVQFSNIYDGEIYDANRMPEGVMQPGFLDSDWNQVTVAAPERMEHITERFSIPVVVKEKRKPVSIWNGRDGETILDMGQNISGFLTFRDTLKKGQKVVFKYAELLQNGKICQENLAGARQEFIYISDGKGKLVRPHFTYYGFQYVQVEGFSGEISADDFEGWCLYSDLPVTGKLTTGHKKINTFIRNALWSQKDNFIDHPSDCPQRAERLGWTGDAQIYCATASFNMYTAAFFRKYMCDVNQEQRHKKGMVPFIVPKIKGRGMDSKDDEVSAGWSDAATIIPWTMYTFYGDKNLLREEYPGMKSWVEYLIRQDESGGGKNLWQTGFHFGDWLALDNPEPGPFGLTDKYYIACCYYYYSTMITAKAAKVLSQQEDALRYESRAASIKKAILEEYFDQELICRQDTQTGYALAIYMGILPEDAVYKNGKKLAEKIRNNGCHLDTGFVGTAYLLPALTVAGQTDTAYELLLQEQVPGWLYQVNMGATTVWESWRIIDEDGTLTDPSSLNHYAFGVAVEWIYRVVCGINPMEEYPGFQKVRLTPHPEKRLKHAVCSLDTPAGEYEIGWKMEQDGRTEIKAVIPVSGSASFRMPGTGEEKELGSGVHEFELIIP